MHRIDINHCAEASLCERVPNIGEVRAKVLVRNRPYRSVKEAFRHMFVSADLEDMATYHTALV